MAVEKYVRVDVNVSLQGCHVELFAIVTENVKEIYNSPHPHKRFYLPLILRYEK